MKKNSFFKNDYDSKVFNEFILLRTFVIVIFATISSAAMPLDISGIRNIEERENAIIDYNKDEHRNMTVVQQQNRIAISGTGTDESGIPLPGVTIMVRGTTRGTTTDNNGNFELNSSIGTTLIFSFVGYESQELSVKENASRDLTIVLKEDVSQLSEVVVTGYTTDEISLLPWHKSTWRFSERIPPPRY